MKIVFVQKKRRCSYKIRIYLQQSVLLHYTTFVYQSLASYLSTSHNQSLTSLKYPFIPYVTFKEMWIGISAQLDQYFVCSKKTAYVRIKKRYIRKKVSFDYSTFVYQSFASYLSTSYNQSLTFLWNPLIPYVHVFPNLQRETCESVHLRSYIST